MELSFLELSLRSISAYRPILDTKELTLVCQLLSACNQKDGMKALDSYTKLFYQLYSNHYTSLGSWLWDYLRYTESPYGQMVEHNKKNTTLEQTAHRELELLIELAATPAETYLLTIQSLLPLEHSLLVDTLPKWEHTVPFTVSDLVQFYRKNGCGQYAQYRTFLWENGILVPVTDPDCPKPIELLGYDHQRQQVLENTKLLMAGHTANNVLLFGDGGTGKSATVKSMLYLSGMEDLRLIEIQKENLVGMPQLIRSLAGKRQKFILYKDDLAFDEDDLTYSSLKTILEGGLEKRPANVAIYATSNRRHLVRQNFSDRGTDEVDAFETIAEKTALAERFGLRIPYMTMNKKEYLSLIDHLASLFHIVMEPELLHAKAMEWEIRHAGRTPRVARQFIASLVSDAIQ